MCQAHWKVVHSTAKLIRWHSTQHASAGDNYQTSPLTRTPAKHLIFFLHLQSEITMSSSLQMGRGRVLTFRGAKSDTGVTDDKLSTEADTNDGGH